MKKSATKFEIEVNGRLFSDATVSIADQLEVNLVTLPGQDSAVLAVTAFIPEAARGGNHVRAENVVVHPGDSVKITLSTVEDAATTLGNAGDEVESYPSDDSGLICSFCGKSNKEVAKFIAGPKAFICDECVAMCQEIIDEET
jgi:hypothetical protein